MTIKEIKSNAPQGATHYINCGSKEVMYYMVTHVSIFFWTGCSWIISLSFDSADNLKPLN